MCLGRIPTDSPFMLRLSYDTFLVHPASGLLSVATVGSRHEVLGELLPPQEWPSANDKQEWKDVSSSLLAP